MGIFPPVAGSVPPSLLNVAYTGTANAFQFLSNEDPWVRQAVTQATEAGATDFGFLRFGATATAFGTAFFDTGIVGGAAQRSINGFTYLPAQTIWQGLTGHDWYLKVRFRQNVASSAGDGCLQGIYNASSYGVRFTDAEAGGTWLAQVVNAAGTTQVDTGVAVDTLLHDLEIYHIGSNVVFALDGAVVASVADARLTGPVPGHQIGAVLTDVTLNWQKVFWGYVP